MFKNKLLILLRQLPIEDLKDYLNYLKKMYPKKGVAIKLMEYIKDSAPAFEEKRLDRKRAFAKLFKGETFKNSKINNTISDLRLHLKEFLLIQYMERFEYQRNYMLLRIYRRVRAKDHFYRLLDQMEDKLNAGPQEDVWHWFKKMQLAHERYYYPSAARRGQEAEKILDAMKGLDQFYTIAKLRYSCELYNRHKVLGEELPTIQFVDQIKALDPTSVTPLFNCYRLSLQLFQKPLDTTYFQLKECFIQYRASFCLQDQWVLSNYLINYSGVAFKKGNHQFSRETFELLQLCDQYGLFSVDEELHSGQFINAVYVATALKEFDWAEQFIDRWEANLRPKERDNTLKMCRGVIAFRKGNFSESLMQLRELEFTSPYLKIRSKWLQLCVFYELKEGTDFILHQSTNFEQFIRRNEQNQQIGTRIAQSVLTSIRLLRKLLQPTPSKTQLLEEIAEANPIHNKKWLLQKINELAD